MRLLIVEDEKKMAELLQRGLREEGYAVDITDTGENALWMAQATAYDALVLDVMLPTMDGFETCSALRKHEVHTPILMLTALNGLTERVRGLDTGADDYLAKPFAFDELLARLRALTRRASIADPPKLTVGDLVLDPALHRVWRGATEITLSAKEFTILRILMRRAGGVVSRFTILEHAWDGEYEHRSNVIEVHIRQLRDKIDRPFNRKSIETVRGAGYRLTDGGFA